MSARHPLRPAVRADVPELAALARATFAATYRASHDAHRIARHCDTVLGDDAVSRWFDAADAACWVATDAHGALCAFAQWQASAAPFPARCPVELKRIYVDAAAQGSGVAARLFDQVRSDALARGADWLWLSVFPGNARARRFYARQGFVELGTVPYPFVDQIEEDLALGLRLAPAPP